MDWSLPTYLPGRWSSWGGIAEDHREADQQNLAPLALRVSAKAPIAALLALGPGRAMPPSKRLALNALRQIEDSNNILKEYQYIAELFQFDQCKFDQIEAFLQQVPCGLLSGCSDHECGMSSDLQYADFKH